MNKNDLSPREIDALTTLYTSHGAWTDAERRSHLSRADHLYAQGILHSVYTVMGEMYLLSATGRKLLFETTEGAVSLHRQLDRAYLRHCMRERGYTFTNETNTRNLRAIIGQMRLSEVTTPGGIALVGGTMSGGGYSRNGVDAIAQRLKSSALAHGFRVILFTPQGTLGHTRAKLYANFLDLIHLVPCRARDQWSRLQFTTQDRAHMASDTGAKITPSTAQDLRNSTALLPESTLDRLQQPRKERLAAFLSDLQIDRTIASNQLHRHYGLTDDDLPKVPYIEGVMRPVHMRTSLEVKTRFYLAAKGDAVRDDHSLMHYAATGEMRRQSDIAADKHWHVNAKHIRSTEAPDAVFDSPYGSVAFEFDGGSYTMTTILKKLGAYKDQGHIETIWGVSSPRRRRNLEAHIKGELKRDITLVEWWRDTTITAT